MRSLLLIVSFALCASLAFAAFTANFKVTGPEMQNGGYRTGTILFDYATHGIRMSFAGSEGFTMTYIYNQNNGNTDSKDQFVYQSSTDGSTCPTCQVSTLDADMPPLDRTPTGTWTAAGSVTVDGQTCSKYVSSRAGQGKRYQATELAIRSGNIPCYVKFEDGRVYTFTNVATASSQTIQPLSDCQCQIRLDLHLLLDDSGSISAAQWRKVNDWVRKLITKFTFGPRASALSITRFSSSAVVVLPLTDDANRINTLMRTNIAQAGSGTNCITGFNSIQNNQLPNSRAGAIGVIITITDGVDANQPVHICNKVQDIKTRNGIQNFVGVFNCPYDGNAQQCAQMLQTVRPQMLCDAGNDPTKIFEYTNYDLFQAGIDGIVASACQANINNAACGAGCCGFCMCSKCSSPSGCTAPACSTNQLAPTPTPGLSCCATPAPKVCNPPDICTLSSCDPATDACANTPRVCSNPDPCKVATCDTTNGCVTADKCTSSDPCLIPECNAGTCSTKPKACPQSDACTSYRCVGGQCVSNVTNCDDGNSCTFDLCDPVNGCQHTPQDCNCSCSQQEDKCTAWQCVRGACNPVSKCINGTDPCYIMTGQCDPVVGCETRLTCEDNNKCTVKTCTAGQCTVAPVDCDDGDECTDDSCDGATGNCRHALKTCTADQCSVASCDPTFPGGCRTTPKNVTEFCDDFNPCTQDACDGATGCVHLNISHLCDDGNPCTDDFCSPLMGCAASNRVCPDQPKCSLGFCANGTCDLFKPDLCEEDVIAIGLSTAAIIGIVIGIIVFVALLGGAAYKAKQMYDARQDLDKYGQQNPLFETGAIEGQSAIFQGKGAADYKRM